MKFPHWLRPKKRVIVAKFFTYHTLRLYTEVKTAFFYAEGNLDDPKLISELEGVLKDETGAECRIISLELGE